ncbi:hypothetical protein ABW19_dt0206189 [Dactylella cylindrospora]|nr:hypothetical protein ABW19_dt0206189 [Dactylella cylindrospora]
MASTTIDQPGPLIQWPQYETPFRLGPFSSSSSSSYSSSSLSSSSSSSNLDLASPGEEAVKTSHRPTAQTCNISVSNKLMHNTQPSISSSTDQAAGVSHQNPNMGKFDDSSSSRSSGGVLSRLSTKVLGLARSNTATELDKNSDCPRHLRRFSLQPEHLIKNRERVGASGLRRSWLFDKRMMPIVPLEQTLQAKPSAGTLFFRLPVELQLDIVTRLIYSDIISLRKSCRAFDNLIVLNEHEIARRQLQTFVEPRYIALYPPDSATQPSFAYLSKLATKSIAASELSRALVTQLYDDFQDKYFDPHPVEAKALIIRYMTERLRFSIMVIQHFLEQFAERKLRFDRINGFPSKADDMQLQEAIMEKYYTTDQLLEASDFYRLTLYLLWQNVSMSRGREPVRRLWALLTDTIPDVQDLTKFMLVGGISELRNVYRKGNRSARRKAIAQFSSRYKNEQARATKLAASLLPRMHQTPGNIRRYSKLAISPNIFHLWIHPAQNVLFRKDLIDGLNQFRCIDEIVGQLLDGWEQWAYGEQEDDSGDEGDDSGQSRRNSSAVAAAA